ncbi:hypothetical protein [Nocardioides sp.]|uniref:hypothetical protein n=1 Tax=Nocardioides sp. TaxID=35761 RepID=UPI001A356C63|nr:hypothetical protein [Nocardioides sp.]MBJ7356309.1 hypothetical protein [Nocardioides sp.]
MADESTCRWCDQGQVFGPVHLYTVVTGSASGEVYAATVPQTGMIRQQTSVPIAVWVCRSCGHLEQFATQPEVLFERFQAGER